MLLMILHSMMVMFDNDEGDVLMMLLLMTRAMCVITTKNDQTMTEDF